MVRATASSRAGSVPKMGYGNGAQDARIGPHPFLVRTNIPPVLPVAGVRILRSVGHYCTVRCSPTTARYLGGGPSCCPAACEFGASRPVSSMPSSSMA